MSGFASRLISWQRSHGRNDLPWQRAGAYYVWLSEIMLQQTQVATVIPYFQRFIASFPTIDALAQAPEDQVLAHWSGLGYYARCRNLHRAAQIVVAQHGGEFPRKFEDVIELPGIGRSTAAAICSLAYRQRHAILDGNVKRVLARYCGIDGSPAVKQVEAQFWSKAESLLPQSDVDIYTQALMDMGATLCTRSRPKCADCPVQGDCVAYQTGRVAELPAPRQRRAVPERSATFLMAMSQDEILLEKRGPSGIWGGLWCLPQFDEAEEWKEYSEGWNVVSQIELPVFTHTFTHFKLHITPLLMHLGDKPPQPAAWLKVDEALSAAIPTPVRQLLEKIASYY